MSASRQTANPFDLVKASDFSDEEISRYWVDLAGEGRLFDLFKPRLTMPMLLLGGKGSGKTHLMRYYSCAVRRLGFRSLTEAIHADGFMGIYVRADGLNVGRFDGKSQTDDNWAAIFSYYFELWLASHFLKNAQELDVNTCEPIFVQDALGLFDSSAPTDVTTFGGLIDHLVVLRKKVDYVVSNVATGRTKLSDVDICISPGSLIFGLPELLVKHSVNLSGVLFVYMIDEIENFTVTQQKFLNSLIRFRRGPVSLKIGARLYGIRTYKTLDGVSEGIRHGAEYERVKLDAWLREHAQGYRDLAAELVRKRLAQAGFDAAVERAQSSVDVLFEKLAEHDYYQSATLALVEKYANLGVDRPYFAALREHIVNWGGFPDRAEAVAGASKIVKLLESPEYPLLEKVNIYLLYKDWSAADKLIDQAQKISASARKFLEGGRKKSESYFQALDHFKSDFLAQLYRDCDKHRVVYAGFETLVHLSQGIPRNLLGLLKQIYRRAQFAGERPFVGPTPIRIGSQINGIRDAAAWFWDDAQPDSHGPESRRAVQALAEFFSAVRFSLKPAECDLSTFTIPTNAGTAAARSVLEHAENWSYLVRIESGGSDRNDIHAVDDKYQLSPMLAPRWEVSEYRRGAISLNEPLFNAIFDPSKRDSLEKLFNDRLKGMQEPFRRVGLDNQGTIF